MSPICRYWQVSVLWPRCLQPYPFGACSSPLTLPAVGSVFSCEKLWAQLPLPILPLQPLSLVFFFPFPPPHSSALTAPFKGQEARRRNPTKHDNLLDDDTRGSQPLPHYGDCDSFCWRAQVWQVWWGGLWLEPQIQNTRVLILFCFFFYCIWSLSVLMHMGLFSTISLGCEDGVTNLVVHPKVIPGLCRLGENPARKVKIL